MYRAMFSGVFARLDAERAHRIGFAALRTARRTPGVLPLVTHGRRPAGTPVEAFGLTFPGPLGLAAGFDKNAKGIDALAAIGFSFVEVGTVTARPQPGNDRPRLFRLVDDQAIVNRMGFNNDGAEVVARRLAARLEHRHRDVVVGVNIGKSRAASDDEAVDDYSASARLLAPYADYLVVNVSSPNTPGLRDLQRADRLRPLLATVIETAERAANRPVPVLVKVSPDLADSDLLQIADVAGEIGLAGVVAVNTTVTREGLLSSHHDVNAAGPGGLSGRPLRERAVEVLALLKAHAPTLPVMSVGGVSTPADLRARLEAGAVLVQAYSAFVYGGPSWPSRVQADA